MSTLPIASPTSSAAAFAQSLATLPLGTPACITAVHEPGALGERLMELGLTAGTAVEVIRRGLAGDPLQLRVRGYMLSLRRQQAQAVSVSLIG